MNIAYFIKPKSSTAYTYDTSTVRQGMERMRHHGFSAIPVLTKDGKYFGTVTEGNVLWFLCGDPAADAEKTKIGEIIRPDRTKPLNLFSTLEELLQKAMEMNFVPVVDDRGCFVGIVTRKDVIRFCAENCIAAPSPDNESKESK